MRHLLTEQYLGIGGGARNNQRIRNSGHYQKFDRKVVDFLNQYLDDIQKRFDEKTQKDMQQEWEGMLAFVKRTFKNGFSKAKGHVRTPAFVTRRSR